MGFQYPYKTLQTTAFIDSSTLVSPDIYSRTLLYNNVTSLPVWKHVVHQLRQLSMWTVLVWAVVLMTSAWKVSKRTFDAQSRGQAYMFIGSLELVDEDLSTKCVYDWTQACIHLKQSKGNPCIVHHLLSRRTSNISLSITGLNTKYKHVLSYR